MEARKLNEYNDWLVFTVPLIIFIGAVILTDRSPASYLILFGTLVLAFILIPTLLDPESGMPRSTSIPAFLSVGILSIGMIYEGLILSAAANIFATALWGFVIRYRTVD